ncbi:putative sam binding domain-containing protein containing protein [Erysiphe neolycopersici]|uniref:Putative sam binding domain-containing protein containing protein n=1 Tax=Erysiphe neolycopersici TaxID=212602 RepID=A0A420I1Q8_9PEZI|nr:putative sam binding domain-containing protein containing protein [Erysiphe neolycopersici]
MLHTPPHSDYKSSSTFSIVAKRAHSHRRDSSERKNAVEISEARQAMSSRGTTASGFQRSMSFRSSSFSRFTGTPSNKKVTTSEHTLQPFISRNGRRYLRDITLPYPLPCDLAETHRQTLRTMLLLQIFNGPLCSPFFQKEPPMRVLEVACGSGYWSEMCHQHFSRLGFKSISFTGIDIAPPDIPVETLENSNINWHFVQHDLRQVPLPFKDEEFCIVMVKDVSMVIPVTDMEQTLMDEYLRILKPGGTLEIWDGDHSLRMLLPHSQSFANEEQDKTSSRAIVNKNLKGNYLLTPETSFAAPTNPYLNEYNVWVSKSLGTRNLSSMPCTMMLPLLIQESESLQDINSHRFAIPLGKIRWENGCVGEPKTNSEHASKGKEKVHESNFSNTTQDALRRTALMTVIQMIESLEPLLREASGKDPDEWDYWMDSMMSDLLRGNGASWGECLEVGAWWARKKMAP